MNNVTQYQVIDPVTARALLVDDEDNCELVMPEQGTRWNSERDANSALGYLRANRLAPSGRLRVEPCVAPMATI